MSILYLIELIYEIKPVVILIDRQMFIFLREIIRFPKYLVILELYAKTNVEIEKICTRKKMQFFRN